MQNLVRNVSAENLTTFGMNLGYNSWTDGAKKIRAKKDNEGILTSWIQILISHRANGQLKTSMLLLIFGKHMVSALMLSFHLPPFQRTHFCRRYFKSRMTVHSYGFFRMWILSVSIWMIIKMYRNVMPIFKMEALMESEIYQILSAHKNFMAFISYIMNRISECISRKSLGLLSSLGTPFLFFYQKTEKATPAVSLPDLPWIPA